MRAASVMIALIAICIIIISLSSVVEENLLNLKKISEDHRYDSLGFAIFIAGSMRLASSLGRLYLLKTSKSKKSGN
jgi:MFS-type transporter involved in bile tolerance (Atg22 family)